MPFTTADVEKHTKKATTDKLKRQWVEVANSWRKNCMKRGGSEDDCDASAIKTANGVIARQVSEQEPGGPEMCVCPDCEYETEKKRGVPCRSMKCPECGAMLVAGTETEEAMPLTEIRQIAKSAIDVGLALANDSGEITAERANKVLRKWEVELSELSGMSVADSASFRVNGHTVTLAELKAAYLQLIEAEWTRKFINDLPDSSFALILPGGEKDEEGKTTPRNLRKLPYKDADGSVDVAHLRNALARLPQTKGLTTAQRASARSKLEAAAKEHLTTHQEEAVFDMGKVRGLLTEALSMLDGHDTMESTGQAVAVARDATAGDMAGLSEVAIETGRRAPVIVDFQILQPGPGNSRDNRYYPADVVERDIHVFEGVDVFATDHQEKERSERTKVGQVLSCPASFTESKAPVASVLLYDPAQAEKARNRADANALATLECSILGTGRVKDGEVDGKKYKIVEAITQGRYLELVSKAGAGGKALNLAEVEPGGNGMTEETKAAPVEEVEEVEIEEADAQVLDGEVVKEAVGKTNLPEFAKRALAERQYPSDSELQAAIKEATAEVKKLTGSGQVTGLGESEAGEPELSLEEREERRKKAFNDVMAEVGLRPV